MDMSSTLRKVSWYVLSVSVLSAAVFVAPKALMRMIEPAHYAFWILSVVAGAAVLTTLAGLLVWSPGASIVQMASRTAAVAICLVGAGVATGFVITALLGHGALLLASPDSYVISLGWILLIALEQMGLIVVASHF
jgi:hypothetical protein